MLKLSAIQKGIEAFRTAYVNVGRYDATAYVKEWIEPSKEARQKWRSAKNELSFARAKLDQFFGEDPSMALACSQPSKYLSIKQGFCQAEQKEEAKYIASNEASFQGLCARDTQLLANQTGFMIELHDYFLQMYSVAAQLDTFVNDLIKKLDEGKQDWQQRVIITEKLYQAELKFQEDNRFQPLIYLLSLPELTLLSPVVFCAERQDEVLALIIKVLDSHHQLLPMITHGITQEISKTSDPATLFRGNSLSTKLMTAYTKMTGEKYLQIIYPLIDYLATSGESLEVDPNKKTDQDDVAVNLRRLERQCDLFLTTIIDNLDACPFSFREMATTLQKEVVKSFSSSRHTSVGGFLFLRFFCPVISAPDAHKFYNKPFSANARRSCVLITKVLQTLANGLQFANKEPYLLGMNTFITQNTARVQQFFDQVATPLKTEYVPLCTTQEVRDIHFPLLHQHLVRNLEKMSEQLLKEGQKEMLYNLFQVLGDLGEVENIEIKPLIKEKTKTKPTNSDKKKKASEGAPKPVLSGTK